MMNRVLLFLSCCLLFLLPYTANTQIINTIEESVESGGNNSGDQSSGSGGSYSNDTSGDEEYYDSGDGGTSIGLYIDGVYFLAKSTAFLFLGSGGGERPFAIAENGGIEFAEYPYDTPYSGLYRPAGDLGFRSRVYAGMHFLNNEQNLSGGFMQVKYSPIRALTVEFNHLQLFESIEGQKELELLGFSTLAAHYNRLRHHRIHAWWGVGLSQMSGQQRYGGPSLLAGTTIFIKRPLSLHLEGQAMWLNTVAVQFYQARIQAHVKRFQIYAGYKGILVDGNHFPAWTLGTGVWF